jgi:hypothetical protein
MLILTDKGGGKVDPDPSRHFLKHNIKEVHPIAAVAVVGWLS